MRLAIIATHPIQYYSPWFRYLAAHSGCEIRVFYLWDFGVTQQKDAGFGAAIQWDVPLLEGYEHEFVPNESGRPGTGSFGGISNPTLRERVLAWNPDAVLLMAYNFAGLLRFIFQWPRKAIPLLFRGDSHRLIPRRGFKESLRRLFIQTVFRRFAAVLSVGKANRAYFLHHGVPADRIFSSPHCVDNERFISSRPEAEADAREWRVELGIPEDQAVLLFVGKFQEIKRTTDLLEAFLEAKVDKVVLLLVGSGEQEGVLRSRAEGNPSVFFASFQNQKKMPRTLAAADIIALPSISESWGLIINEAFCLARPAIVSTHVGCAQDLIEPGETGLIFPAGDVPALSRAISEAFSDRARLRQWGDAAFNRIHRYSYATATEGLVAALNSLSSSQRK